MTEPLLVNEPVIGDVNPEWLRKLSEESRNVLQLTPPAPVSAASIDEAVRMVFSQFILDPEANVEPYERKTVARRALRDAYKSLNLRPRQDFVERPIVRGAAHAEQFDFAVLNGKVAQLTQAFSFQLTRQLELSERIKAWSWTVRDIRKHGGQAHADSLNVMVPREVDIEVVYLPPGDTKDQTVLAEALSAFHDGDVNVRALPVERVHDVAQRASDLLQLLTRRS